MVQERCVLSFAYQIQGPGTDCASVKNHPLLGPAMRPCYNMQRVVIRKLLTMPRRRCCHVV